VRKVFIRFWAIFIPTCVIATVGLLMGLNTNGILCISGWIISILFGFAAVLELFALISGLITLNSWKGVGGQRLEEIEQREAELFTQGKSVDEVIAQREKSKD
jgi:hypothetical protein